MARLEAGEPLVSETREVVHFFRELFSAGRAGDRSACAQLLARGRARGYRQAEMLVGLVQPALAEIGRQWEAAEVTVADEHRFTAWCETMLALLEPTTQDPSAVDIMLLVAPGNQHVLGPRIAEQVFRSKGIGALFVTPTLPTQEVFRLAAHHGASWLGYSCALPHHVAAALDAIEQLRGAGYCGEFLLSGQALRRSPELAAGAPVRLTLTLDEACDSIISAK